MRTQYAWHILMIFVSSIEAHEIVSSSEENNDLESGDNWDFWWSYSGISGPSYWGLLNPDWFMCHNGKKQSPIDIDPDSLVFDAKLKPLQWDKKFLSGVMFNDGHAIIFTLEKAFAPTSATSSSNSSKETENGSSNKNVKKSNGGGGGSVVASRGDKQRSLSPEATSSSSSSSGGGGSGSGDKSNSVGQVASQTDQLSVNEYSLKGLEKDLLSVISMQSIASSAASSSDIPFASLSPQQPVSPASSGTVDYESIEDKSDTDTTKQIDDNTIDNDAVAAAVADDMILEFRGAGLAYSYRFSQLFIRFGSENNRGSEHRIASQSFPAEIQILAYNNKLYKSYQEASTKPSGLLAVSILVDVAHNISTITTTNEGLDKLLESAKKVHHRGKHVQLEHFDVASLVTDPINFVTYDGSLTYPGCYESVIWILLNRPLYIKQSQLDDLRQNLAEETSEVGANGNMIANNFRAPQHLNDRTVRTSISLQPNYNTCRGITRYEYKYGEETESGENSTKD